MAKVIQPKNEMSAEEYVGYLRRLGIDEAEARIMAGLEGHEFRSASQGPREFQPLTPKELAQYED